MMELFKERNVMQKEQLPKNKKFNPLALYLEADQLMNNLRSVLMELRDGSQLAMQKILEQQKKEEKPKKEK